MSENKQIVQKKFVLISPKNRTVYNFRGDLIREIQSRGYQVMVTGPDRADIGKVLELGVEFAEIPMSKTGTSISADVRYFIRLYHFLRKEKPDVTLGYTIKPVVYGGMAARLAGVGNINGMVTGGGYTFASDSTKAKALGVIVRVLYRAGLACSRNVIFHNKDDLREFCDRKLVKQSKCSVVNGSGVNLELFKPSPLPGQITFLMVARLLKSKGVREYLQAARIVKETYASVRFMLLGKYEDGRMPDAVPKEEIESYVQDGVVERFDETDDTSLFYNACSVYVLTSYREGLPRTVLEAMATGRAIITTDVNGCRDTVAEGKNGFLVPARDVEALSDKMKWFILQPEQIGIMGEESLRFCEEKFDVSVVNQDMVRILGIEDKV